MKNLNKLNSNDFSFQDYKYDFASYNDKNFKNIKKVLQQTHIKNSS